VIAMKQTDVFPGRFLRAADLDGKTPVVTIESSKLEVVGAGQKLVIYFVGKAKGLVVNRTNFETIAAVTGLEDTDDWPGHKIKLITTIVDYQGRRVLAIRVAEAG